MNPYLKRLREQYDALKSSTQGLQTRAASENRDLSDTELQSITDQATQMRSLATQIEELSDLETRSAAVAQLGAKIAGASTEDGDDDTENRSAGDQGGAQRLGNTTAKDRDPGHYRSLKAGGQRSFFGDIYRSRINDDQTAATRLREHNRALDTAGEGVGLVAPKWLTEEYEKLARQGRALANAVRNIPLGDDPRPITLPKQTAGTDAVVGEQAAENDPVTGTDAFDTDVDTVTPKPTSGKQTISRQMYDMSSPAVDLLIYGDLLEVYDLKVENKCGAAIIAVGTAIAASQAQFLDMGTDETNGSDLAVRAAIAVRSARKLPANILAMTVDRWGEYLKLKDASGRPLVPEETAGPMNVVGVGSVAVDGRIRGLGIVATDGMYGDGDPDVFAAIRASDVLLFESNVLRFRFEEVSGPESIVLGIWGYTAVKVRQGTKSVKRVEIDTTP
jgi:hypothetical protein